MKLTKKLLSKIIKEEISKVEGNSRPAIDSIDAQIDSMFVQFEQQAVSKQEESKVFSLNILLEEEGEEQANQEQPAQNENPIDEEKEPIDVDQFGRRVARLVENYENLLDIKTAIMARARKFLEENYGPEQASDFDDVLDKQYGLAIEPKDNTPMRPAAVGAGPDV